MADSLNEIMRGIKKAIDSLDDVETYEEGFEKLSVLLPEAKDAGMERFRLASYGTALNKAINGVQGKGGLLSRVKEGERKKISEAYNSFLKELQILVPEVTEAAQLQAGLKGVKLQSDDQEDEEEEEFGSSNEAENEQVEPNVGGMGPQIPTAQPISDDTTKADPGKVDVIPDAPDINAQPEGVFASPPEPPPLSPESPGLPKPTTPVEGSVATPKTAGDLQSQIGAVKLKKPGESKRDSDNSAKPNTPGGLQGIMNVLANKVSSKPALKDVVNKYSNVEVPKVTSGEDQSWKDDKAAEDQAAADSQLPQKNDSKQDTNKGGAVENNSVTLSAEKPKIPVTAPVVEKKPPISTAQPSGSNIESKVEPEKAKVVIPKPPASPTASKDTSSSKPAQPVEKKIDIQPVPASTAKPKAGAKGTLVLAAIEKLKEQKKEGTIPATETKPSETGDVSNVVSPDSTQLNKVPDAPPMEIPKTDDVTSTSASDNSAVKVPPVESKSVESKEVPSTAKPNEAPPVPLFTGKKSEVKPAIPLPPKPYVSKTTPDSGKPSDVPPPLPEYKPLEFDKPHESKEKAPPVPPLPSGTVNVADTVMPDASKGPPLPPYNTVSKPTAKPSGEVPTVPTAGQTKEVPTAKPKVPTVGSSVKDKIQALEAQGKLPIMPTAKPAVPKSQTTTSPATPVKPDVAGLNAATATKPADTQAASTKPPIPARPPKSPQQENALIAIGRMKKVVDFLEINSSKMNVDASRNFNQLKQTQQKLDELYKQKNYAEIIKIMHASDEKGEYATTIAKLHSATKPVQTDIARKMNDLSRAVQNMPDKDNFNKIHKDEIVALLNMKKYIYNKYSSSYFKKNPTALEQFQDDYNKINKEIDRFHAMIKGDQKLAAQGQDQQQSMSKITTGYAGQQQSGSNVYSPTQGPQDGSLDLFNLKQQAGSGIKFGHNIEPEKYKVFAEKSIEYIQGQINSKTSVTYQNVQFEGAKDPMNHTLLIDNNERIKRMHDNKDTATITIKNPPSDKGIAILFDINKELPVLSMKDCHGVTDTKTLLRLLQGALLAGRSLEDGTFQLHEDDKKELEKDPIYQEMKQKNLLQSADFVKHVDGLKSQGKDYKLGESLEGITPAPKPDEIRFTGKPGQTH